MDWDLLPLPENAPPPGSCVRIERPEPGLAVVVLDPPHRKIAVFDAPLLRDLEAAVSELEADRELRGVVLTGREPLSFAAGADVEAIARLDDPGVVRSIVGQVHALFRRIEDLEARTVAAVGGPVPGGAYEISLCCDLIVAADDPTTRIGLPEVKLGIVPGWGGSHRLPERIGVPAALNAILNGSLVPARVALRRGMVDRLTYPERLVEIASDLAMGREKRRRRPRGWKKWAVDKDPLALKLIASQARKQVLAKTHGHYPAPLAAVELVTRAPFASRAEAAEREAEAVAELATGKVCKSLVFLFFASEAAKKLGRLPDGERPRAHRNAAVVGAGVMGGGIASLLALKGMDTRLFDLSQDALDRSLWHHRADVEKQRRRRRLQRHEANAAIDRLTTSTETNGLKHRDFVLEAVAERMDVKKQVFATLAEKVPADCLLATNTSSLSVTEMSEAVPNPARFVGMHFFNPPKKMPLVEVVRGAHTSDETVAETAALALRLGKTPVVVADVAGFLVNRILGPYLDEAVCLFVDGADPARLDRAMLDFGMPMGPLRLLDEVGLDIAEHVSRTLFEAYGVRMTPCPAIPELMGPERLGVKTGRGFYRYPSAKGRKRPKPELMGDLARFQRGDAARGLSDEELVLRMVLVMVAEAARCLEEGVVETPELLDLATVFGTGFAPFRGGLLHYADDLGVDRVVRELERLSRAPDVARRPGGPERFAPPEWLRRKAEAGARIFDRP